VLALGIGWLNAATSREVGSDVPDSSPTIQQVAPRNDEIAASTNWIRGTPTRSKEILHPALRVAQSDPDVSATGNPTIAPLKWAGLVVNYAALDDESVFYLTDPGDTPVGAIPMRQITAPGNATARDDDARSVDGADAHLP
jgi:hypothetical protein